MLLPIHSINSVMNVFIKVNVISTIFALEVLSDFPVNSSNRLNQAILAKRECYQ